MNSVCVIADVESPHCQSIWGSGNANPAEQPYGAEVESEPALSSQHLVNNCASVISDLKAAGIAQSVVNSVVTTFGRYCPENSRACKRVSHSVVIIQDKKVLLTLPLFTEAVQEHLFASEVTRTKILLLFQKEKKILLLFMLMIFLIQEWRE